MEKALIIDLTVWKLAVCCMHWTPKRTKQRLRQLHITVMQKLFERKMGEDEKYNNCRDNFS